MKSKSIQLNRPYLPCRLETLRLVQDEARRTNRSVQQTVEMIINDYFDFVPAARIERKQSLATRIRDKFFGD